MPLDAVCAAILPFLDGAHNRDASQRKLLAIVQEGRVRLVDNATGTDLKDDALKAAAKEHVTLALDKLAAGGLLEWTLPRASTARLMAICAPRTRKGNHC